MPKNEQEFVSYLSKHFRLIEALCARGTGFESNDELVSFLAMHTDEPESASRRASRLKEVGVLVQGAVGWMPPPFLVKFVSELKQRHVLASPKIVQGWIGQLDGFAQQLADEVDRALNSLGLTNDGQLKPLLVDIQYTFSEIVRIVHSNCERIALEVADYRATEDVSRIGQRLKRLIELHDEYLQPLIQLIDINGDFYDIAGRIVQSCAVIASNEAAFRPVLREATSLRQLVVWLRVAVIHQAEEANRELAPLCLAAAQEQLISKGVNRALEFARHGEWDSLDVPNQLKILDDQNSLLFSDLAVERYLIDVQLFEDEPPPIIQFQTPEEVEPELTSADVIEQLELSGSKDLLDSVLTRHEYLPLERAIQLVHDVIAVAPESVRATDEQRTYQREPFEAEAFRWAWRSDNDDNNTDASDPDASTFGRSISTA